jgi:aspartate/methionine/tyrosine aminotransferase
MKANELTTSRMQHIQKSQIRKIFDKAPEGSINMGLGELQFPTPPKIRQFAANLLSSGNIPYTPNAGDPQLIESILNYYNSPSDQSVCVTVGAEEALFLSILTYAGKGDEVLISDPGFVAYESIVNIAEAVPVKFDLLPENSFKLERSQLLSKINSTTKMIIVSNPSNPLGISFSQEEFELLLSISREHDILLVVDEIYRELYHTLKPDTFAGKGDRILVVSGLSKSHCMTGWRIGWMIGNSDLVNPIIPLHQYICTCAPFLSQKTADFALSEAGMSEKEEIRIKLHSNFIHLKDSLLRALPQLKILEPAASPYLFFRAGENELKLVKELAEAGVISLPGSIFGSNGKGWIRISYGLDREVLEEAVDRIIPILR